MTYILKGFQDDIEIDNSIVFEGADLGIEQKQVKPGGTVEGAQTSVGISNVTKPLELELNGLFSPNSKPFIVDNWPLQVRLT